MIEKLRVISTWGSRPIYEFRWLAAETVGVWTNHAFWHEGYMLENWDGSKFKVRYRKNHFRMSLSQFAGVAINLVILLAFFGILSFDLHWPNDELTLYGFHSNKIKAFIPVWKVDIPIRLGEQSGNVQFSQLVKCLETALAWTSV